MRVLIAGLGKSGTTALYHLVLAASPAETIGLFEPKDADPSQGEWMVVKALLHRMTGWGRLDAFDRRVLLVRDPRDRLISWMLYWPYNTLLHRDEAECRRYLDLLRQKEVAPGSVSLLELWKQLRPHFPGPPFWPPETAWERALEFHDERAGWFVFRYEDLVAGNLDALSRYLGLPRPLPLSVEVPDHLSRVVRTRAAGYWPHWFTDEDVAHFRPFMAAFIERYGYADGWQIAEAPAIRPGHCSLYFERLLEERRRGDRSG